MKRKIFKQIRTRNRLKNKNSNRNNFSNRKIHNSPIFQYHLLLKWIYPYLWQMPNPSIVTIPQKPKLSFNTLQKYIHKKNQENISRRREEY